MREIAKIATNVERGAHDIWFSKNTTAVSHPEECQDWYLEVEDSSYWFQHRAACIVACMRSFPPKGPVFDIGGGNGHVSLAIKNAGFSSVLVEPSASAVMNAHARGLEDIVCATVEQAGFLDSTLPAVGLFDVLEHIEDDVRFLGMLKRLLVPSGRLYLTVPAYNAIWSYYDDFVQHYRRYTVKTVRTILESVGYVIDFETYVFSVLPVPIFLFRTIPGKLRLRQASNRQRYRTEHGRQRGLLHGLLTETLKLELSALKQERRIPFGSSCLLVAHTP